MHFQTLHFSFIRITILIGMIVITGFTSSSRAAEPSLWDRPASLAEAQESFTTYYAWDIFAGTNPYAPDAANFGPNTASLQAPDFIVTISQNLYAMEVSPVSVITPSFDLGSNGYTTFFLQAPAVAGSLGTTTGFQLDVNGISYSPLAVSNGGYYFQVAGSAASYTFSFNISAAHTSIESVSIDAIWSETAIDLGALGSGSGSSIIPGPSYSTAGFGYAEAPKIYPGTIPVGVFTSVGVNNSGTAVSAAHLKVGGVTQGYRAVRWDESGIASELANLGTDTSGVTDMKASAINEHGQIAGYANKYDANGNSLGARSVRWDASGAVTELGHLGLSSAGVTTSRTYDINDEGTVVGYAVKYLDGVTKGNRATRWEAGGSSVTELASINTNNSGTSGGFAYAINNAGTTVGVSNKYDGNTSIGTRAVYWAAGSAAPVELGGLGSSSAGSTSSVAYAINERGAIAGSATKYESGANLGARAVRWEAGSTTATELGILGSDSTGAGRSVGWAINEAGDIAGYSIEYVNGENAGARAALWRGGSTEIIELENLGTDASGFAESYAFDINNAGFAVGYAQSYDQAGAFLGNRAIVWALDGTAIDLNSLIDDGSNWVFNQALAISDTGYISGIGTFTDVGGSYERTFTFEASQFGVVPEPSTYALLGLGGALMAGALRRRKRFHA